MASPRHTPERVSAICDLIADGMSLRKACEANGCDARRFLEWCAESPDTDGHYARALDCRGVHHADRIGELAEAAASGKHDPAAARVAIDAYKWTAARMAPKRYGDRQHTEVSAAPDLAATLASLIDRLPQ